jgi:SAM-dependent methyltransferase
MNWVDEQTLEFEGMRFLVTFDPVLGSGKSTADRFLLLKAKPQLEEYIKLSLELKPKRILELGIAQGGSVVCFQKLFKPERLVAIELDPDLPVLRDYIAHNKLQDRVRPFFEVNQGDRKRLLEIVDGEFPGQELDLVIDDASHRLTETRTSFNVLFPRLRPGGVFVIEDWGWEHWPGTWQTDANRFHGSLPLTNLIFELVMTAASDSGVVANVSVWNSMVMVQRGSRPLGADFDISKSYLIHDRPNFALMFGDCDQATLAIARTIRRVGEPRSLLKKVVRAAARRLGSP